MKAILSLFVRRTFGPLFFAQALSVFADHLLRNAALFLIVYVITADAPELGRDYASIALAAFSLPYFLFSSIGGELVDRLDKAWLARRIMFGDAVIMLLAALAFMSSQAWTLVVVLFLAGTRATLFGPLKYAILPQHLERKDLVTATGLIQASSFVAIVAGQTAGGLLDRESVGPVIIGLSMGAFLFSRLIPKGPPDMPPVEIDWNIARGTWRIVRVTLAEPVLRNAVFGLSWFYALGAVFTGQFVSFARNELGLAQTVATALLAVFSLGIVVGSLCIGSYSKGDISTRASAPAAALLGLFTCDLYFVSQGINVRSQLLTLDAFLSFPSSWRILFDVFGIAAFSAIFAVPFQAVLQTAGPSDRRGRDLSANNVVNALLVVVALLAVTILNALNMSIAQIFLVFGLMTLGVATLEQRRRFYAHHPIG